jgi:hypothetical protein
MAVRLEGTLRRRLLDALLGATARWARREPFDEAVATRIRHGLILDQHLRHVERIPAYRRLAEDLGLDGPATLTAIVDELVFSADLYKSYDPDWLAGGDFGRMTAWLEDVSACRAGAATADARDLSAWQRRLAAEQVFLTMSSATSGRPSLVPRDAATWQALRGNGRFYAESAFAGPAPYDCLALVPRQGGLGLQSAAAGLAAAARRRHWLLDSPADAHGDWRGRALSAAGDFLARAAREGRAAVVFGPPAEVATLCEAILADGASVRLPSGSRVATGGGWKTGRPLSRGRLAELVEAAIGVPPGALTDGYSATELNVVLSTCAEGRYHVPPLVELAVLDDGLRWIRGDDAEGALAFLDPFADAYVGFLALGDRARVSTRPCPCGLMGPAVVGEIVRAPSEAPRGCAAAVDALTA